MFLSSVHLLLNCWSLKKDPQNSDDLAAVYTAIDILGSMEQR